ncbi:ABC transporter ATP-binding protein [Mycoplasmopsis bovirhinis]|uniref:ABC-type multidrug/protein/lipid transport system ATPase component n=2 Tax=Mycoplasmopsis bovirhinis TaxID=29553 RepID=A0A449AET8_9BACT|nr:ABC transporter ATP-binding protein [Mycoplasmopsis bovirhinis]VEU63504.1 ABC-type multidrug/protein/lipid transport system ATPase component [Mycoplasmopsis bovirhinis]
MIQTLKILPKKIKIQFLIGVLILVLNVGLTMLTPIFISQFLPLLIDKKELYEIEVFKNVIYSAKDFTSAFIFLLVSTIALIISGALTSFGSLFIIVWAGENASEFYRNILYAKYQKLSLKDISHFSVESLITRINDDVAVFWEFLVGATSALIKAPLFIAFGLIFALLTDLTLTWTIVAIVPLIIGSIIYILIKVMPLIIKGRTIIDNNTKSVNEIINGARLIKAYNLQEYQYQKFNQTNKAWKDNGINVFNIFSINLPFFFFAVNLVIVFIFYGGYRLLADNPSQDVSKLIAKINTFIEYEFMMALGVSMFGQFLGTFFRARVSSKRIIDVINAKYDNLIVSNGETLPHDPSKYSIKIENFSYKYFKTSENYALKNINFELEAGQTLGIIGPTGSGKSTLANILVNNMKYTQGSVKIADKEVNQINSADLHKQVGIVFQEALLYSGTIESNLKFAKEDASEDEINKAIESACAKEFITSFPDTYEHIIEQRGKNLSGGQKQRLSVARTLLTDPKVLILDDTTSALDNLTAKKMVENIAKNYKCTTVIISQKVNSIKQADKILVLNNGEILDIGTHEELINRCAWYQDVYQNQLEQ